MADPAVYSDLTWDVLTSWEPQLLLLADVAMALDPADEEGWAFRVKAPLCALVGWESGRAPDDPLGVERAYVVAFDYLLALREGA